MFSRSKTASNGGSTGNNHAGGSFSVIGADVSITGNIGAQADLHIDGIVEGDIQCAALVQGESSRIKGSVTADSARLSGIVDGSISARELVIERTAHITGDVCYETISIAPGGRVEGRFTLRGGALLADGGEAQLKLVSVAE
ncbi:polymer-forming cytoskeletal protein [Sphingomonas colocasiae]|uniref:Polymer-forming cytoskeletal protein n=1 Tax=Sphingomonas colocasiae TaxID=1848973 RepID=A0ABS7PXD8_9SPHN|nr:polymer-forming cytoskeletal protein [Sphingomonas colocasiae]